MIDEVRRVGVASVAPVHQMMRMGERHPAIAAGPFASTGASPQRRSGGRAWQPERPADIDHCGVGSEEDATDTGITREGAARLRKTPLPRAVRLTEL